MEKNKKILSYIEDIKKQFENNSKSNSPKSNKYNSRNRIVFDSKVLQFDLAPYQTLTSNQNSVHRTIQINTKILSFDQNDDFNKNDTLNDKENLNLKYTFINDYSFNIKNKTKFNKLTDRLKEEQKLKDKNCVDKKVGDSFTINFGETKNNNKNKKLKMKKQIGRNITAMIKEKNFELQYSGNTDKSLRNWNELKKNYIEHIKNQEYLKKYEKSNLDKTHFKNSSKRKYYFGRKQIQGLPYFYDTISTYMNKYQNKSEQNRHELIINELCKLRAYLIKFKIENSIDVIKDFLTKHNMPNMEKYSNYQLIQFGNFVCQDDMYKLFSLLKPYMHIKDMIKDILQNSENLNQKFSSFKYNSSIKNLLNNFKSNQSLPVYIRSRKFFSFKTHKQENTKNKKFYISELDYSMNKKDNKEKTSISNISQNEDGINKSKNNYNMNETNDINENNEINLEEEKKVFENNKKDFNKYRLKRKEILKNIGIQTKNIFKHIDNKDSYFSPLFNSKTFQKNYDNNIRKIKLPKISNHIGSYYKPNKFLLSPDKNYSMNFSLLYKDVTKELNNFQNNYEKKFDDNIQRSNFINSKNSQSCENINKENLLIKKKLEQNNRLYFGKKNIKADFEEIQRKQKLTEYIALINAKSHIKNELINDNVINY